MQGDPHPTDDSSASRRDEALALAAARGSRRDFDILVDRYAPRLYNFLRRRCANESDVDDLLQRSFVEAWSSIERYDAAWRFSTWLYTIAARTAIHLYRCEQREQRTQNAAAINGRVQRPAQPTPLQRIAAEEAAENLWRRVDALLPREQAWALWLRYADDFEIEDIARILDRPVVTTRVLLHRARKTLEAGLALVVDDDDDRYGAGLNVTATPSPH